jgi:hypothetical protein
MIFITNILLAADISTQGVHTSCSQCSMSSGKDAMWEDNVGPSLYAKAQGRPVKIWGLFGGGRLEYYVLPADPEKPKQKTTHMNTQRYAWLVQSKFAAWRRKCFPGSGPVHLVQDGEKCLWVKENQKHIADAGFTLLKQYPKYSPDLNHIERWWHRLRQRLETHAPEDFESREDFIDRLRRTVTWMNKHLRKEALQQCTNLEERAREVLKMGGKRTKF